MKMEKSKTSKKLPEISISSFIVKLPVLKQSITMRPFLVKEEKILLTALESFDKNPENTYHNILQVIQNCILTETIKVESLSSIDVETLFFELRKKSVSETVQVSLNNRTFFDCKLQECPEEKTLVINLDKVILKNHENTKKIIELTHNTGIVLKPPIMKYIDIDKEKSNTDKLFKMIVGSIDSIYSGDEVYSSSEYNENELLEWVENNLSKNNFEKVIEWLNEQPYYYFSQIIKCDTCGKEKEYEMKGLGSFFI